MEIKTEKISNLTLAEIIGRVDANNSSELESALTKILDGGESKILVNMNGLVYISSSGLRVFLLIAKKLEKTGKIALCCLQPQVEQIFTISGFNSIFPILATLEEGIAHLNQNPQ